MPNTWATQINSIVKCAGLAAKLASAKSWNALTLATTTSTGSITRRFGVRLILAAFYPNLAITRRQSFMESQKTTIIWINFFKLNPPLPSFFTLARDLSLYEHPFILSKASFNSFVQGCYPISWHWLLNTKILMVQVARILRKTKNTWARSNQWLGRIFKDRTRFKYYWRRFHLVTIKSDGCCCSWYYHSSPSNGSSSILCQQNEKSRIIRKDYNRRRYVEIGF